MVKKPEIRFQGSVELSAVHAAFVVATGGSCSDAKTEAALVQPTTEINTRLLVASVDVRQFWEFLFSEIAVGVPLRESCNQALLKAGCSELQLDQTAAAVGSRLDECRMAFEKRYPKLPEQLKLRAGPLKDRWQTFGPGLLIEIANQIWDSSPPQDWWPAKIDVMLVQPIRGGDGGCEADDCRVWIEAMLTDADPNVSEILRLAFWITQVAIEQHLNSKHPVSPDFDEAGETGSGELRPMRSHAAPLPWKLGSVPIVLSAGNELDLFRSPGLPVASAVGLWRLGSSDVAQTVESWWQQWLDANAPMPVALKALDKMLAPLRERTSKNDHIPPNDLADLETE